MTMRFEVPTRDTSYGDKAARVIVRSLNKAGAITRSFRFVQQKKDSEEVIKEERRISS